MNTAHDTSLSCEPPSRNGALVLQGGHRARCSCGWWSDCYAQLGDTQRAVAVHLRRAYRVDFEGAIVNRRGVRRPTKKKRTNHQAVWR